MGLIKQSPPLVVHSHPHACFLACPRVMAPTHMGPQAWMDWHVHDIFGLHGRPSLPAKHPSVRLCGWLCVSQSAA